MKALSYALTIISSTIFWLASLYVMPIIGLFVFCWQCGTKETNLWLFWPLVYLLALSAAYLFSKLPTEYGGGNWSLAAGTMLILGAVFYFTYK